MTAVDAKNEMERDAFVSAPLGIGSWMILVVLVLLLGGTIVVSYLGWTLGSGTEMPASAYVAMAFGVVISLGVGFGLMGLIFYSSRNGYDTPPMLIPPDDNRNQGSTE